MDKHTHLKSDSGIVLVISYFVLFVVNCAIVILANTIFPRQVVLGTISLTPIWATMLSMGILSLVCTFAIPFVRIYENNRKKMFTSLEWMALYFVLNFVGIWLITRGATELGMGISSWVVAFFLAIVLDTFQGVAMMQIEKMK